VASEPIRIPESIRIGEDFELDVRAYQLRRSGRAVKLERIPMELLLLLVEQKGQLVTRDQIIARIWGKNVFLDADNSINAAIRKIRHAFKDDPEHPRFIQTITGKGYRFIASAIENDLPQPEQQAIHQVAAPAENLLGKKVSHYRVLQVLGGGGMGVVYKAEDLKLGRQVAVKFLPAELTSDATALERLQREARAASSLDHPNICAIYEFDEYEGRPFIVMQLLEGQTLREWIEASDASSCTTQLLKLSIQICSGLEAAHEKGVIHRDIKPANIFVTSRGEAKILDFGVAKIVSQDELPDGAHLGEASSADPSLTRTGASLGTPSYLSPEQVRREKLDARTDLFSFGSVLYEMATGRRAFSGNSVAAIRDSVLHQAATPPRQLQPGVPAGLESIINKALEKDRDLRYQTATELRNDLQKLSATLAATSASMPALPSSTKVARIHENLWKILVPVLMLLLAAITYGAFHYYSQRASRLTEKDTIVLADFTNSTGDPVFDDTLKQGLSIALRQSPFLSVLSDDKVNSTLKLMTRPAGTALTPAVAREVCQRAGSKAYIEGAIAALGNDYVLGLKAVNCRNGDIMAREQVTATSKEQVISVLGSAAARVRAELGESLATVEQHDVPLKQATTSSLDALKAYSMASAEAARGRYAEAIPFYKRAVEIDSNFAAAYAHMGQTYENSGYNDQAVASIKKAFELQGRASEPEKFYIITRYYELVTGEVEKRIEALQLWKRMYPRDPVPPNDLGAEYTDMGKYEQALVEAGEKVRLSPDQHTGYELLGVSYLGLNRFGDAKATRQKEIDLKIDYHWDHIDLYGIAFLQNDLAGMQRERAWAKGNKYEFLMLRTIAGEQASQGKLRDAKETYRQAMESAQQAGFADAARKMTIDVALIETMFGSVPAKLGNLADAAGTNQTALTNAGRLYAMTGNARQANAIADDLVKRSPAATYVNNVWGPSIRAEIELNRNNPEKAIDLLQSTIPYEFGWKAQMWPTYLRGRAYLQAQRGKDAAAEFQKILDHRGVSLAGSLSPVVYTLSQLQMARAHAISGDAAAARAAYQNFLNLWKDADPDLPILQKARSELAKLQ
jgi:eukaryotic-like serine/threonine-protein kinase